VISGSKHALLAEVFVMSPFLIAAIIGFRTSLWVVVVSLAAHGVFDWCHGFVVTNPGMPAWWPAFCLAYDVCAAGILAWLLTSSRLVAAGTVKATMRSE
jgi:hypothetical protein